MVCFSSDNYYYNNRNETSNPYEDDDLPPLEHAGDYYNDDEEVNPADDEEGEEGAQNDNQEQEEGLMFPFEYEDTDLLRQRYVLSFPYGTYTDIPENITEEETPLYRVERRPMLLSRLLYENLTQMLGNIPNQEE